MHSKVAAPPPLTELEVEVIFADSVYNTDIGPSPLKTKDIARRRQWHVASLVNNVENVIFILFFSWFSDKIKASVKEAQSYFFFPPPFAFSFFFLLFFRFMLHAGVNSEAPRASNFLNLAAVCLRELES